MKPKNEDQGFGAGWQQLRLVDIPAVKAEIMQILGVTTEASFRNYRQGRLVPDRIKADQIEKVFSNYGVNQNIWGAATA